MITSSPILQNSETPNSESKKVFSALSASLRLCVNISTYRGLWRDSMRHLHTRM